MQRRARTEAGASAIATATTRAAADMVKTMKIVVDAMSDTETRSDTASTAAMATSRNEASVEADEVAAGARVRTGEAGPDRLNLRDDTVTIAINETTTQAVIVRGIPRLLSASTAGTETMTRGTIHRHVASMIARIVEEIEHRLHLECNAIQWRPLDRFLHRDYLECGDCGAAPSRRVNEAAGSNASKKTRCAA